MKNNLEKKDGGPIPPNENIEDIRRKEVGGQEEATAEDVHLPAFHKSHEREDGQAKSEAERDLEQAYGQKPGETPQDTQKEAERMVKEAEGELKRLIDEKKQSKKELSQVEIYRITKQFYLDKLDYEVKLKGILGRKARIWDKKSESYVPGDQAQKPIEFRLMRSPKEETPLLKFLRESYETRIRNSLVKEGSGKDRAGKTEGKRDLGEGAIRDLAEAWDEQEKTEDELKRYTEENLSERMKQKEDKWQEEIRKANNSRGEELTPAEKRSLERDLYIQELSGYSVKYQEGLIGALKGVWSALVTGREKVRILKDGKPVEKNGKPVEFKVNWAHKHPEQDMLDFLKGEITNQTRKELERDFKKEIVKKTKEQAGSQEKTEESSAKPSAEAEVSEKEKEYQEWLKSVGARDAQELTGSFEKEEEYQQWLKSVGAAEAMKLAKAFEKYKAGEIKKDRKGEVDEEKDSVRPDGKGEADTRQKQTEEEPQGMPGKPEQNKGTEKEWRGIDFKKMEAEGVFEKIKKLDVSKNSEKIIEIIKRYVLGISLPDSLESLLKKYDQSRREEHKFGRMKIDLESLKNWITFFLNEIRDQKKLEKLEEVKLDTESKDEEPVVENKPAVKGRKTRKKTEKTKLEKKPPAEQGPDTSPAPEINESDEEGLDGEDSESRSRRKKTKKKESGTEGRLEWMEQAIALNQNGSFNFKITPELKRFFKDRGYSQEQIRKMSKDPKAAWDEASDIYQKEQKGIAEE